MAALLYAGPGSLVTGPMALLHHSIRSGSGVDVIDVLVPVGRQRLSTGFARLHRTARMPARASSAGPVRLALVPRAVADTVRQLTELRDVRAVVADAVQLGRCTVGQLAEELRIGPVKGSAMFRSVLAEVADGIRSTAEGDLRDLIRTARLPMPLFNPSLYDGDLFLGKPDGWWPDAGVAGEVDSRAWHLSPDDWDRTRRRHDRMAAAGIIVLHFSPRELRREPAKVAEMIKGALNRGLTRPALPIRTIPLRQRLDASMNVAFYRLYSCRTPHSLNSREPALGRYAGKCRVWRRGLAFGEGEGHFFYGEQGGDVEGEELAAVHDGLQAAEGGLGGGGGGELAQVGLGVGELHSGA